eukprot:CAMPEP_0185725434 /NCGR_PEP_ID=MMETSP1171-20130828/1705_1 /TAXON_ID=374046 /ORGANISM="Helicotheca tamensis, Strain CCMP826" /LENGTH=135 /DNA_ID=CAMNT_0028393569 /DNA_START=165 /DNA_END=572 /DNA_ORIENTATION=-
MSTESCKPSPFEGDSGKLATQVHHGMTNFLAVVTPIYFMVPESYSDGMVGKSLGAILAVNISAHSWIGLNYVVTDYVPKISKKLMGPARIVSAGIGLVTLLGLGKIALMTEGGLKGTLKGLWTPKKVEEEAKESS